MIKIAAFIDVKEIDINYSELKKLLMDSFSDHHLSIDIEGCDQIKEPESYDMSFDIQGMEYDEGEDKVFSSVSIAVENTAISKEYEFGAGEIGELGNTRFYKLLNELLVIIRTTNVIVTLL